MTAMLLSLALLAVGAAGAATLGRTGFKWLGPLAAVAGGLAALVAGLTALLTGARWEVSAPWPAPLGALHIGLDPLSAVFVVLIAVVGALAAVYGRGYLGDDQGDGKVAMSWCWYNLLMASMLLVVVARDGFLFLVAWEIMSLVSFFLVMFDHNREQVIRAGWIYLVATHLGTAFLLVMFLVLGHGGDLDFAHLSASGPAATLVFLAALIGFGTKAGLVPMHVWLPEAHPAAPSHVSALMSGVMIKTGIYGLIRVMLLLGEPAAWWGWVLVVVGAVSGLAGVLFALAQHDLKRLLAYHSVENIGIIALGLGLGVLGITSGHPALAFLGLCGGLLHVINHGVFKSLLFLGAGSVLHATGTRDLDRLGGLIKRLPVTGATFLVGAAAICALPPLNGFVSEFLIYGAAFSGVSTGGQVWAGLVVIAALALIGGLALACFTKAFGVVFLGEPRTRAAAEAHEASAAMEWPMVILAGLCGLIGLASPWMIRLIMPAAAQLAPLAASPSLLAGLPQLLLRISLAALGLIGLAGALVWLRARLLSRRTVGETTTWDCGYAAPTARMQYTASSFAQPIVDMFRPVLGTKTDLMPPQGLFPTKAGLHTHTTDLFIERLFGPAARIISRLAGAFHQLQQGRTHLYVLYIVVTILVLLIWNLW